MKANNTLPTPPSILIELPNGEIVYPLDDLNYYGYSCGNVRYTASNEEKACFLAEWYADCDEELQALITLDDLCLMILNAIPDFN